MPIIAAIGQPYGLDMASQSIDQKSDSRALGTLARVALCLCSDVLRRVAASRIIPGVLRLGRSSLPSPSHALWPCGSFSRAR